MRVSWNWLSEHVDLDGLTASEVADKLTMSGLEVEEIHEIGADLDGIVVGRVVTCGPHPDADKLRVTTVDAGQEEALPVVCGAPNCAEGILAPIALPGATMPAGFKIKKSKLRGQPSHGMLCSSSELGLDEDHDGLLLLDDAAPGTPIAEALGIRDTVIELSVTPNRGDALSIRGVAREVAALFGRATKAPPSFAVPPAQGAVADHVAIRIDDPAGCRRYAGSVLEDVRVGPSPAWLKNRLRALGQRPVNNLVDVTNYVLFELGQPLHAFDLDQLAGPEIVVRDAREGETVTTLDGQERAVEPGDLLICDAQRPVAVAGVMGAANSEIGDDTSRVLIEIANFDPSRVRRTKSKLKLFTESSFRFERGVDVSAIPAVMQRTIELICATQAELGHTCKVIEGTVDVYPRPYEAPRITLPSDLPQRILGTEVSGQRASEILVSLGVPARLDGATIVVDVPAFRPDLERPIDLVEEVGRVLGFDKLPSKPLVGALGFEPAHRATPPVEQPSDPVLSPARIARLARLRAAAVDSGYFEAVNWAMSDPAKLQTLRGDEPTLRLQNPLGEETSVLRTTLLAGLLTNVAHNVARGAASVALFEIGSVFPSVGTPLENDEPQHFAAVLTGRESLGWSGPGRAFDAFDMVGLLESLSDVLERPLHVSSAPAPPWAHPSVTGEVRLGETPVGWIGQLHPNVVDGWELEAPVYAMEVSLRALFGVDEPTPVGTLPPKTPASRRDLALELERSVTHADVERALRGVQQKVLESFELFDVYEGDGVGEGRKSIALRFTYRDPGASLTDKQVEKAHGKVVAHLTRALDATQR